MLDERLPKDSIRERAVAITESVSFSTPIIEGIILDLLEMGWQCYVYGIPYGCVIFSAMSVERALRVELKDKDSNFKCLIELAEARGIITPEAAKIAHDLRKKRNVYVHVDSRKVWANIFSTYRHT
jgi:hypothetical protein